MKVEICYGVQLGLRYLLFLTWLSIHLSLQAQSNGVRLEVYTGIPGVAVADLTGHASFPDSPTSEEIRPNFEAPTDVLDNYGQRMRALLTAPTTGNHVFWISSDDASHLFLSTDATPANKQLIARVDGWTSPRQCNREANQRSASIALTAGQSYYIEALMKEGGGGDNLAVTWQRPGDPIPGNGAPPISGAYLAPYGLGPPIITTQPASVSVVEGAWATFSVRLERSLELMDSRSDNRLPSNWAASDETTKAPWTLIEVTGRYNQTANLDGINWEAVGYNDASWPSGPALLYYENASLPAPKNTLLTLGRMTYYFRTHFNFAGEPGSVGLRLPLFSMMARSSI